MASIKVSGIFTLAKSGRVQMQLTALRGVFIIGPPPEPRLLRRLNREWEDPPMIGYTGPIQCLRFRRSITLPRPCYPSLHLYFIALCTLVRPAKRKIRIFGEIEKFRAILPFFFYIRESMCLGFAIIARDGIMIDGTARWVTSSGMNYWSMVSYNNKNSFLVRRYKNEYIYTSWIFNENTFFSEMKIFLENSFIINKRFLYQIFE